MTWGSRCFEKFGPGCLWWSPAYRDWLLTGTEALTTGRGAVVSIQQHQAEAFRKVKTGIKETMHSEALKSHHLLTGMATTEVVQTDSNLGFDWQHAPSDSAQIAARFTISKWDWFHNWPFSWLWNHQGSSRTKWPAIQLVNQPQLQFYFNLNDLVGTNHKRTLVKGCFHIPSKCDEWSF